jgi:release factor glutamine methyltransferase
LGLKIACDRRALIPRPETERLAQLAAAALQPLGEDGRFADIGTGSGCIALALLQLTRASGMATDLSADALALASENAEALGLASRLRFAQGDLLSPLQGDFDLVVSNPPYIPAGDESSLQPEVQEYEPKMALFSGVDGLQQLKRLCEAPPPCLKSGGWMMLECGKGQAEGLKQASQGVWAEARVDDDPFGVPRFLILRKG